MDAQTPSAEPTGTAELDRLDSWKQIASYLGKSERTVRRWQQSEGLPVHRHIHQQRGSVWAYKKELDDWLEGRRLGPEPLPESPEPQRRFGRWTLHVRAAIALASVAAITAVLWQNRRPSAAIIPDAVQLTALPGAAYGPVFSPDGRQVAFYWSPAAEQDPGIYLKTIGSDTVTPLLTHKVAGGEFIYGPSWSPDGRTIAFLRRVARQKGFAMYATASETWLCLIGSVGGPERRLIRLAADVVFYANSTHLSWSSDGQWIVAPMADGERRGIHKISVASGETRQITRAIGHEFAPLLSPDGRALVFMRQEGPAPASIEHVLRQNLAADGSPEGAPQVLFEGRSMSSGLAWTSSGKELVFCTSDSAFYGPFNSRLYRMRADGRYPLVPLGLSGCSTVATSRPDASGHVMMVYASGDNTKGRLWQAGLDALDRAAPLAPSSRFDGLPSYSPDGSFVAFVSNRSGSPEVWVARRDGTGTKKVTENSHVSSIPRWSPDGARLVYGAAAPPDQAAAGSALYGLYIAPIAGAAPSRVHLGVQSASDPSWSPDGQWIYYWSGSQIWRTRPDGTGSNLVGEHPAHFVRPGILEGGRMYYTRSGKPFALCRASVETGKEELLVDALATPFFSVTRKFVYFIKLTDRNLYALPVFGGPERRLGRLPESEGIGRIILGISVSPDDASIVWAITNGQQLDLQLVRDFR